MGGSEWVDGQEFEDDLSHSDDDDVDRDLQFDPSAENIQEFPATMTSTGSGEPDSAAVESNRTKFFSAVGLDEVILPCHR